MKYAGKDATSAYEPIHPPDALDKNLPREKHLGPIASEDAQKLKKASDERKKTQDELRMERAEKEKPPLSRIINYQELEDVARSVLSYKAYAYYASAGDDEISESCLATSVELRTQLSSAHNENIRAFSRLFFHARVLRPISQCDPSSTILGFKTRIPVFASGAALAKLGHPLGTTSTAISLSQLMVTLAIYRRSEHHPRLRQDGPHPDDLLQRLPLRR